jgi:hypothetical protein
MRRMCPYFWGKKVMVANGMFRTVNPDLAGRLAIAAKSRGEDITRVVSILRNGPHPLNAITCHVLLSGLQHAAALWIGKNALGVSTPDVNATACDVANEVLTWLSEKVPIYGKQTDFLDAPHAIRQRIEAHALAIIEHCGTTE